MRRPLIALCLALTGACTSADDGVPPEPVARTLLTHPRHMVLDPDGAAARMYATFDRGDRIFRGRAVVDLVDGEMVVEADPDGVLVIDRLQLSIGDVVAGAGIIGDDGLLLTDIRVHPGVGTPLGRPPEAIRLATEWAPGGSVGYGSFDGDWTLSWALQLDSGPYPLLDQTLTGITTWVTVYGDVHDLRFDLIAWNQGVMWNWSDIVELSDLVALGSGPWVPEVD